MRRLAAAQSRPKRESAFDVSDKGMHVRESPFADLVPEIGDFGVAGCRFADHLVQGRQLLLGADHGLRVKLKLSSGIWFGADGLHVVTPINGDGSVGAGDRLLD